MQDDIHSLPTQQVSVVLPTPKDYPRTRSKLMEFTNWCIGNSWKLGANGKDAEFIATVCSVSYVQSSGVLLLDNNLQCVIRECIAQNMLKYYGTSGNPFVVPLPTAYVRRRYQDDTMSRH